MTIPTRTYPDPTINMETVQYWAAAQKGVLLLKKCTECGKTHFYPRAICPHCFSSDTTWYEASGLGRIYSFSVMRRASVPYVMAYVTLDEGVTMMSNIVECDFDTIKINQPVEVLFHKTEGEHALPVFRPIS